MKQVFSIETAGGIAAEAVQTLLQGVSFGSKRFCVKDISKDVAILRGQEPKPHNEAVKEAKFILHNIGQSLPADQFYRLLSRLTVALGGQKLEEETGQRVPAAGEAIAGSIAEGDDMGCADPIMEKLKKHIEQLETELHHCKDDATQERELSDSAVQKLKTQLSECGLAANGATHVERDAKGWSQAYEEVSLLRTMYEDASANYRRTVNKLTMRGSRAVEDKPVWGKSIIETLREEREKAHSEGVRSVYETMRMKSSILLTEAVAIRDEVSLQGGDLSITDMCGIFETIGIAIKNDLPGVKP